MLVCFHTGGSHVQLNLGTGGKQLAALAASFWVCTVPAMHRTALVWLHRLDVRPRDLRATLVSSNVRS